MKIKFLKKRVLQFTTIILLVLSHISMMAQTKNTMPASFNISNTELTKLLAFKMNEKIDLKSNIYLDKSTVVYKYDNADLKVRQLKLKLTYFKDAFLTVQINADNSKQIFITSNKTEANYKNRDFKATDVIVMDKCKQDDIISE